jgi:hypothetical protein
MLPTLVETAVDLIEIAMRQDQVTVKTSGNFKRQLSGNLGAARAALALWQRRG